MPEDKGDRDAPEPIQFGDAFFVGRVHGCDEPAGGRIAPSRQPFTVAGMPKAMAPGGRSFVTTAPAPTIQPSPITTPPSTVTPAPSQTSRPMCVGRRTSGWERMG